VYRSFAFLSAKKAGSHCNLLTVASKSGKINPSRAFSTIFSTVPPPLCLLAVTPGLLVVIPEGDLLLALRSAWLQAKLPKCGFARM
jgi:hypothetical protein